MKYLIDVGSSTVKVYTRDVGTVTLIKSKTFAFKDGFEPDTGLSATNTDSLFDYFDFLCSELGTTRVNTKVYATGIFREMSNPFEFVEEFYIRHHLYFNIVSHELEQFFLEKAWTGQYDGDEPLMVINIGGRTTELVFFDSGEIVGREMLPIGVGLVIRDNPSVNDQYSSVSIDTIMRTVRQQLPNVSTHFRLAICTGGELTYMKLAGYALESNISFIDSTHPSSISLVDYDLRNREVFEKVSIDTLQSLMPENPSWMSGARAYSAIAQAICEHYGVEVIVPSDSNLIDGVNVQEAKRVVLCGSYNKHLPQIAELASKLRRRGIEVLSPRDTRLVGSHDGFVLFEGDKLVNQCTWSIEAVHLRAVEQSDIVIICNFDDYIGTKTALEIGYTYRAGGRLIFLNDGASVTDFDLPSEVGLLMN